jgi:hypothetical protein
MKLIPTLACYTLGIKTEVVNISRAICIHASEHHDADAGGSSDAAHRQRQGVGIKASDVEGRQMS